jgi:hypothetical protein
VKEIWQDIIQLSGGRAKSMLRDRGLHIPYQTESREATAFQPHDPQTMVFDTLHFLLHQFFLALSGQTRGKDAEKRSISSPI